MTTVGVLGLGAMGMPVAAALVGAADVIGFDIRADRMAAAVSAGIAPAASADALLAAADVVVLVLPGAEQQRRALLAETPGPLAGMRRGALLVEMTSGDPRLTRDLAAVADAAGVDVVAAPIAGGPGEAWKRSLGFFVAGSARARERALSWLGLLAAPGRISVVGDDPGHAQTVKLAVNAVWFGQVVLLAETLLFAAADGVEESLLQDVLTTSAADSAVVRDYLPRLLRGDYVTSFGLAGVVEELETVADLARALRTPATTLSHVSALHLEALDTVGGGAGELGAARMLEQQAGRLLRSPAPAAPSDGASACLSLGE